jgi:hypothetical protein
MKQRTTQLGVRKNPDSPRVHGLRLTVTSSSRRSAGQAGHSSQSEPSSQDERVALRAAGDRDL